MPGLNIDLQEMEFGTVVKRRTSQPPPDERQAIVAGLSKQLARCDKALIGNSA